MHCYSLMKLVIWVGVALLQILFIKLNFLNSLEKISLGFHLAAYHFLEKIPSSWNWFFEAILIGRNEGLRGRPEMQSFFTLGIYYLLVVSGIHVLALEKALQKSFRFFPTKVKNRLVFFSLLVFCLINRNQPPCFRALISYLLNKNMGTKPVLQGDLQFIITCLCLSIQPAWISSLSFQLSCAATLGIAMASSFKVKHHFGRRLLSTVLCTVSMGPLLFYIQPCVSWLIIPANIVALPLFEALIMPMSLITAVAQPLYRISEKILAAIFKLTTYFAYFEKPALCLDEQKLKAWGLIYIVALYSIWRLIIPMFYSTRFWQEQDRVHGPLRKFLL